MRKGRRRHRDFFFGRVLRKEYGSAWSLSARWGRLYFELNVGKDKRTGSGVDSGRAA